MSNEREDGKVKGVQIITKGARVMVAVDWSERDEQSFSVSSGEVTIYDSDAVATSISGRSVQVTTGLLSRPRTQFVIDSAESSALDAGYYTVRWTLTLGDGQVRVIDEYLRVRSP